MSLPRISDLEKELARLREREGDIAVSCDGFFGECPGVRLHVKHQTKTGRFWHQQIHSEAERGEKLVQITHL